MITLIELLLHLPWFSEYHKMPSMVFHDSTRRPPGYYSVTSSDSHRNPFHGIKLHMNVSILYMGHSEPMPGNGTPLSTWIIPDSKVPGANMGPIWGRQNPGGPHVGTMNLAIWDATCHAILKASCLFIRTCLSFHHDIHIRWHNSSSLLTRLPDFQLGQCQNHAKFQSNT